MDTVTSSLLLEEAFENMKKFKMKEAEECFCRILDNHQEASASTDATPIPKQVQWVDQSTRLSHEELDILSKTLSGLADLSLRKAQTKRHSRPDWFFHYLRAIAYLKEVVHLCEKNEDLDEDGWKDMDVVYRKINVEQRMEMLQTTYVKHLNWAIVHEQDKTVNFDWLDEFQTFIVQCIYPKPELVKEESVAENPKTEACAVSRENSVKAMKNEKKPRTMDINKLQKAISKLVRNIASDIRSRYRRRLSEETMRRSVSCEIVSLLSPISDDEELANLFEMVIAEDEEPEEISTTLELDIDTSAVKSGLRSKRESSDSLSSCTSSPRHLPKVKLSSSSSLSSKSDEKCPEMDKVELSTKDDSLGPNGSKSGTPKSSGSTDDMTASVQENNNNPTSVVMEDPNGNTPATMVILDESATKEAGPPYNLPGVLTLWKSYHSERPATLNLKPYHLQGFEEVSPLTESGISMFTETGRHPSPRQNISIHPFTPSRLYETLADVLTQVGTLYKSDSTCDLATEIYKYALGLVYQCSANNRNGLRIANILRKIGVIKSSRGDIVPGCQLLNEAMQVYKALPVKDQHIRIVRVWLELGQAYLKEQGHVTSLFNHIMNEVRSELSQEFKPNTFHIPITEESDDSDSSQGDSYSLHIYEAVDCLNSALTELQKLKHKEDGSQSLLITILTKLADCHIVTGNYDKAICLYEEAMGHCKHTQGSEIIENNAHMLSMLGICNFLLGHYPKAASLLETASVLQQHMHGQGSNFGTIFTVTMLALNYYKMRQYHRCIIWCMKSNDLTLRLYDSSFEEIISTLDYNRAWYIIQNLFTLGYAYYTLDFNDKAVMFLERAKGLLERCEETDIKQHVKLLKVIADTYVKVEWHESALEVYKSALTIAATIGDENSSLALTNQLLNCMASVEVQVRHYSGAADYLEQALDHQKNVESTIKEDLIGLEYQLGKTYILAGDIDKAIDCFEDCVESLTDIPGTPGKEMVGAFGKLANLYFVKGLMQEDEDYMNELLLMAKGNYSKAVSSDERSTASIHYANYMMQQGEYPDAVSLMLPQVFLKQISTDKEITFAGVEQALIPEHLSQECTGVDEVIFETKMLACFIALLCFKQLRLIKDADDCLVVMYKSALSSKNYFSHILMGYAFLESRLFEEAAESFAFSSTLMSCEDVHLAVTTSCLCYCVHMYQIMFKGFLHIQQYLASQSMAQQKTTTEEMGKSPASNTHEHGTFYERKEESQCEEIETDIKQESFEDQFTVNMTISSFESSTSKSRSDGLNTSSHYESDSSFITDQSMLSDDSMSSENLSRERRDSYKRMDNTSFISEDEVWETLDEKGNVIETKVIKSNAVPSTIYEVENNGNFTSDYDQVIQDLQLIAGETSNANYQSMIEIVSTPQNENWSMTQMCDNENVIRNETTASIVVTTAQLSSPKRKLPESVYTYPSKYMNKSVYSSSYLPPDRAEGQDMESDSISDEEVWETFEETVDTPPELIALLKSQGKF